MGLWSTIKGWFGMTSDQATGGRYGDAVDAAETTRDASADPKGALGDAAGDVADDATGGAVSDTRYAAGTASGAASDPGGMIEHEADDATGGSGDVRDAADTADDLRRDED